MDITTKFSDNQKKLLEKVYQRILDQGERLTEEGKSLCREADINPQDLVVRTREHFLEQVGGIEEIADIRYSHYQVKRLKQPNIINKLIEHIHYQKKIEADMAEKEYQRKQLRKRDPIQERPT